MTALMPLDSFFTLTNPPVPRAKSLLSRFSSPLTKRSRNTFEFEIKPESPFKIYSPGESVKGEIVLSVYKGFDITHLVIALHGVAKVFKHQTTPGEGHPTTEVLVNGKGSRGFEYYGNGLASLFQDEQTLCGSGFLKKQLYKFGFELQFPALSLPSTIDFERGTISYLISASVTRPTAISPVTTHYKKVLFRDRIDVESMQAPKSRAISLEPVTRRGKVKKVKTAASNGPTEPSGQGQLSRQNTQTSTNSRSTAPLQNPPLSPAPSEDTIATQHTASTTSYNVKEHSDPPTRKPSPNASEARSSTTSSSARTITATTQIPRNGTLAGDTLPVRVRVSHTKAVRGMVIATLYRQGRVDLHPAIPLAPKGKKNQTEYEDVYPRSRTGLGGLYFANGSPSSVFRKDLTQSSTMMIVDPHSLSADIHLSLRVPEDAFPTIDNVPGGMIAFTYHVEVVIDLTGKLGEARFLPSLTSIGPTFTTASETGNQLTSNWANNILDTSPLRRTKTVATFDFPVVVGTQDSSRNAQSAKPPRPVPSPTPPPCFHDDTRDHREWPGHHDQPGVRDDGWDPPGQDGWHEYGDYYGYDDDGGRGDGPWYDDQGRVVHEYWAPPGPTPDGRFPPLVPPPERQEPTDEKTRLRRQEELLLPSQPPESGESSRRAAAAVPSALDFDDARNMLPPHPPTTREDEASSSSRPVPMSRSSARSPDTVRADPMTPPPSLPDEQFGHATEDKQELERRRLIAQASAPPPADGDDVEEASTSAINGHVPTAPVIDDDEEYVAHVLNRIGNEHLPQYRQ